MNLSHCWECAIPFLGLIRQRTSPFYLDLVSILNSHDDTRRVDDCLDGSKQAIECNALSDLL